MYLYIATHAKEACVLGLFADDDVNMHMYNVLVYYAILGISIKNQQSLFNSCLHFKSGP